MNFISVFLSRIMDWCYAFCGNYGWAIVLFTFLTKIILLPLSLWTYFNGITMIKIQPDINFIKVKYYGQPDQIAEEQAKLFKEKKYSPLASVTPTVVQMLLLIAVVGVIRMGIENPAIDMHFGPVNLGDVPAEKGLSLIWSPLVAGLAAYILCIAQNRSNVLQAEQSNLMKNGTMILSVGLSLYLGWFVAVGTAFYWVCSNLFAVLQLYICNWIVKPRQYVNYERLEESRRQLAELEGVGKKKKEGYFSENRRRERADYKRFFSVVNKHLVFYSESNGFYKYFGPVLDEIFSRSNITVHYITSDPDDNVFKLAQDNPRLKAYYIGQKKLITLFMRMDADVVVMTMSDLENYYYKRSYVRKDIRYIYMFHYPLSTHMVLHTGALDHYDEILCVGEFQIPEIRKAEELAGLPEKKLDVCGYCQLDSLYKSYMAMEKKENSIPRILIAPSWQDSNILDSCIGPLLKNLIGRGWNITVRPHPEYMKRYKARMDLIINRWKDYSGGDLIFETDFTSNESIYASDVVITDWSGTATEFSFVTLRPCIFINTPPKINNPDYVKLGIEPQELQLRKKIGYELNMDELAKTGECINILLNDSDKWHEKIKTIRDSLIANFPDSAQYSAKAILDAVIEQQNSKSND